jgi:hypothetical protein
MIAALGIITRSKRPSFLTALTQLRRKKNYLGVTLEVFLFPIHIVANRKLHRDKLFSRAEDARGYQLQPDISGPSDGYLVSITQEMGSTQPCLTDGLPPGARKKKIRGV